MVARPRRQGRNMLRLGAVAASLAVSAALCNRAAHHQAAAAHLGGPGGATGPRPMLLYGGLRSLRPPDLGLAAIPPPPPAQAHPPGAPPTTRAFPQSVGRRQVLGGAAAAAAAATALARPSVAALPDGSLSDAQLNEAAQQAAKLFQAGDYAGSEAIWRQLEARNPGNVFIQASLGACVLSQAQTFVQPGAETPPSAEAARRLEEALGHLELALASDALARDPIILDQRAAVLELLRRWPEAQEAYSQALSAAPRGFASIPRQGVALMLYQQGEDDAAEREAETLLRRDPEFIDARAFLAAVYWAKGDQAGSENAWSEICEGVRPAAATNMLGRAVQDAGLAMGISKYAPRAGGQEFCRMYSSMDAVSARWPPRAQVAYRQFLARRDRER